PPLALAVGRPERQRPLDVLLDPGLLLVGHEVVAGVDRARVVLDADPRVLLLVPEDPALALGHGLVPELAGGGGVAPVAEGPLHELHDVALVDEAHALPLGLERVADRSPHE